MTATISHAGRDRAQSRYADPNPPSLAQLLGIEIPGWMSNAACSGVGGDAFFPEKGEPVTAQKRVCAGCPVRAECDEYAWDNNERFGIWGGSSENDRRKQRRAA